MGQTNAERLYDLIYDYLEINPMEIGELLTVFEQIKYEQFREMIDEQDQG